MFIISNAEHVHPRHTTLTASMGGDGKRMEALAFDSSTMLAADVAISVMNWSVDIEFRSNGRCTLKW